MEERDRTGAAVDRPGWSIEALVAALMLSLVVSGVVGWRDADNANYNRFPPPLSYVPGPRPSGGLLTLTATHLNRDPPRVPGAAVRYVSESQTSTGPSVVSVHPIDPDTWAAVALGRNGRCYATLATETASGFGDTYYAEFPVGTSCMGVEANRETVTSTVEPG